MSMATRCIACGTIFRVVQDQLKVSDGWVRCGRCDEVFNALDGLFDLEREAPPPWQPGDADRLRRDAGFQKTAAELDEDDRIASRFFRPEQEDVAQTPAEAVAERDRMDFADAQFNSELLADEEAGDTGAEVAKPPLRRSKGKPDAPSFVRAAEQQAHWQSPRVRLGLSLATLLLIATLGMQVGHQFHDFMAAQWPQAKPLLVRWCEFAHCRIEAPRRIDDVTVESSALTRAAAGTDTFKLAITLRNRGALPVTMPSVDLTLSDTSGELVARRALGPTDFQVNSSVLAPGAEAPLQLLLTAGSPRVSGYTVEIFYP